jgi:hypothetical protein
VRGDKLMPKMTQAEYGDAIRAAFEEGYMQGTYHTRGRSIITEAKRISLAFWDRVMDRAVKDGVA